MTFRAFAIVAIMAFGSMPFVPASGRAADSSDAAVRAVLTDAVENFFRPGYRRVQDRAAAMGNAVEALCTEAGDERLQKTRAAFAEAVSAWSRMETVRFGPILHQNAAERLYFFPDRRGIGLRQVQGVLAKKDETATAADTLAAKSVALQGLGTLEFLLFGTGAEEMAANGDSFRCRFAEAVTARVEATAATVANEWSEPGGIANRFANPDSAYADFRTQEDSLRALLGTFTNGLELIADARIVPFLGGDENKARPKAAAWWRAGLTGDALAQNLGGLSELYDEAGMQRLLPTENSNLSSEIRFEFANAQRALSGIDQPLPKLAEDEKDRSPVAYLLIVTRSLRSLFAERFAGAIGLVAGFSSLDGD
ncbi:imelysin family protein [Notoacmeibacter sp. MSK16QG-6]|uniref:imelysin family protein n=1 Tax=Notoacmeibacter sp. MSK16QG-6 TaxID=2957982 RepID=UPI00209F7420|nr:imelysin family protein [Notoacmeibacter sp. MSK16QG-6]MCP1198567.1 peptidase M75, Imelysin [Notoacmeibacter sp. MSK16QG-6]